jgi:hypothetical protein
VGSLLPPRTLRGEAQEKWRTPPHLPLIQGGATGILAPQRAIRGNGRASRALTGRVVSRIEGRRRLYRCHYAGQAHQRLASRGQILATRLSRVSPLGPIFSNNPETVVSADSGTGQVINLTLRSGESLDHQRAYRELLKWATPAKAPCPSGRVWNRQCTAWRMWPGCSVADIPRPRKTCGRAASRRSRSKAAESTSSPSPLCIRCSV